MVRMYGVWVWLRWWCDGRRWVRMAAGDSYVGSKYSNAMQCSCTGNTAAKRHGGAGNEMGRQQQQCCGDSNKCDSRRQQYAAASAMQCSSCSNGYGAAAAAGTAAATMQRLGLHVLAMLSNSKCLTAICNVNVLHNGCDGYAAAINACMQNGGKYSSNS